jgi:hypothetical protein
LLFFGLNQEFRSTWGTWFLVPPFSRIYVYQFLTFMITCVPKFGWMAWNTSESPWTIHCRSSLVSIDSHVEL